MPVARVYPLYVQKLERKGRTPAELDEVIRWLTGFGDAQIRAHLDAETTFEDFFAAADLNPDAGLITGVICGVRVEQIEDPLMQKIRYLDKLVDELWNSKKQIVSVAMPIKDGQGLSSVALDTHKWRPRRLTMKELAGLPATFDNESLHHNLELKRHIGKPNGPILFNTGLWIADIRGRWPEGVCFDINNEIRCLNDEFVCEFEPEDWLFSRWCYNHEVPYAVTRAVKADHVGSHAYPNYETWGHDRDEQNIAVVEPPQADEIGPAEVHERGKLGEQLQRSGVP